MLYPLIGTPGPWEIALILLVVLMFFGAAKLPELARGTGRALRIFKAETKGLMDDDDDESTDGSTTEKRSELDSPETRQTEKRQTEATDDIIAPESRRDTTN